MADFVARFSSHSMRVGHITSASERGISIADIVKSSAHKTERMVHTYIRVVEQAKCSSLKGSRL
jgi:hypothetical protein